MNDIVVTIHKKARSVFKGIKNYSGSKYFVFNRPEIDRQLQLIAGKS
jgi:hypothetical protein